MNETVSRHRSEPVDLLVGEVRAAELKKEATGLRSIDLNDRQMCDIELLLSGALAPLGGFMNRSDYESALLNQRLANGAFFPMPITLDVDAALAKSLNRGERVVLRDDEGAMLALLTVEDVWAPDRQRERELICPNGERDATLGEPVELAELYAVGGQLEGISLPVHHDYPDLRTTPKRLWTELRASGMDRVIVVDPAADLPPQRHQAIGAVARELQALILMQPAIGCVRPTDLAQHRRIKQYRSALSCYAAGSARLALLALVPRGTGSRALLLQAIVHRNSGATHLLVDPSDYGLGDGAEGSAAVRDLAVRLEADIGIELLSSSDLGNPAEDLNTVDQNMDEEMGLPPGQDAVGAIRSGGDRRSKSGGFTCFFTGLSGAGKSTVARALAARLATLGRPVTLLDGDLVRRHLSSELTFSKAHRDLNIQRIGFVASEITRHGGIAICAPIAPYRVTRGMVRGMVEAVGEFLEIHVATPLAVCEQRDPKGLYAKAHAGLIKDFTGIDDPYEVPEQPELTIDTSRTSVDAAIALVLSELRRRNCLDDLEPDLHEVAGGRRSAGLEVSGRLD